MVLQLPAMHKEIQISWIPSPMNSNDAIPTCMISPLHLALFILHERSYSSESLECFLNSVISFFSTQETWAHLQLAAHHGV